MPAGSEPVAKSGGQTQPQEALLHAEDGRHGGAEITDPQGWFLEDRVHWLLCES